MIVSLRAQMRLERGWANVVVQNISRQGMMLWSSKPPSRGAYLELRRATQTIIARAVWVSGKFFGVKTEEPLNISALLSNVALQTPATKFPAQPVTPAPQQDEPRRAALPLNASIVDISLVVLVVMLGGVIAAAPAYDALQVASHAVAARLTGGT